VVIVLASDVSHDRYIRALLPFDEDLFKAAISEQNDVRMAAALGGAFAAVVRAAPEVFQDRRARLNFCVAVSGAPFFGPGLPVWLVEATVQGALGSAAAVERVSPELLVEIQVVALEQLSGKVVTAENRGRLIEEAIQVADGVWRLLSAPEAPPPAGGD
jgi:hypothetical protein